MRNLDISREYEMRNRESAYRNVAADINRAYNDGQIDLSEKYKLEAENHHRYINTPDPEDERAQNEKLKKIDFSKPFRYANIHELEATAHRFAGYGKIELDRENHMRYLAIFGSVFHQEGDFWRYDHAERETI